MSKSATAMQIDMRALASREIPISVFCGQDFLYAFTKERARAEAIDEWKAGRPLANRRRLKREGNRAFKKTVPDWAPVADLPAQGVDRNAQSWWNNRYGEAA